MTVNRRVFLTQAAVSLAASLTVRNAQSSPHHVAIKAIAFDAFPIFDPRSIAQSCELMFPGHGSELNNLWRTKQFEYQWLRALGGHYEDFWTSTQDALLFAARSLKLELSNPRRDALMQGYLTLKAWPDVPHALEQLRQLDIQLAILSNATTQILDAGIENSGLSGIFQHVISTNQVKTFKPTARAYQLGTDTLGLHKEQILFVAFAGWDVAGAKWFGYPTYWNNRQDAPMECLGATPDGVGSTLEDLVRFVQSTK